MSSRAANKARRVAALARIGAHAARCKRGCRVEMGGIIAHLAFSCPTGMRLDRAQKWTHGGGVKR